MPAAACIVSYFCFQSHAWPVVVPLYMPLSVSASFFLPMSFSVPRPLYLYASALHKTDAYRCRGTKANKRTQPSVSVCLLVYPLPPLPAYLLLSVSAFMFFANDCLCVLVLATVILCVPLLLPMSVCASSISSPLHICVIASLCLHLSLSVSSFLSSSPFLSNS